jgi:hypothetical protein
MTAAALGCNSRKELCARFRGVNQATQCDLDRLNKWVQGRSLPRAVVGLQAIVAGRVVRMAAACFEAFGHALYLTTAPTVVAGTNSPREHGERRKGQQARNFNRRCTRMNADEKPGTSPTLASLASMVLTLSACICVHLRLNISSPPWDRVRRAGSFAFLH